MKVKATKDELRDGYYRIIRVGYCDAQFLLQYQQPRTYCVGVYGWSCDNYDLGGVLLSTGYSPLDNKNVEWKYDLLRDYEKNAEKWWHDHTITGVTQRKRINTLLRNFVKRVTGGNCGTIN